MIDVLDTFNCLTTFVLWAPRQKTIRYLVNTFGIAEARHWLSPYDLELSLMSEYLRSTIDNKIIRRGETENYSVHFAWAMENEVF